MEEFLGKYTKNILLFLAEEFETNVSATDKKKTIIQAILAASDYNESFARSNLECILKEDAERKEMERKKLALEREDEEREKTRQFEFKKLRIQNSSEDVSLSPSDINVGSHRNPKINLKELVPRFDSKLIDITLFFMIFEKQAEKLNFRKRI